MRIAVTGHRGDLGVRLVPLLEGAGHTVLGYDRLEHPAYDVTDAPYTRKMLLAFMPDVIVHLASVVGVLADYDPRRAFSVNIEGTFNVADVAHSCRASLIRVSCASAGGVHGLTARCADEVLRHFCAKTDLMAVTVLSADPFPDIMRLLDEHPFERNHYRIVGAR
jgi:nucleoside-diphosphate-sugar epimerase